MELKQLWLVAVLVSVTSISTGLLAKPKSDAPLGALEHAKTWLNSEPLRVDDLRGKVVLVDFWTYTCINWRRTLPWLRSWDQKYRDRGLVIIGVHTPEFGFEKELANVQVAARDERVDYPIALDSDYTVWNAFNNQYWPALYLIDAQGRIRHRKFGEGEYDQLELVIQELLAEAGHDVAKVPSVTMEGAGAEAPADWKNLQTPEAYVGYARAENFASPGSALPDRARVYAAPALLHLNEWALTGYWTIGKEYAVSHKANGRIVFRFHARDVHLVMGPTAKGAPIRFRVSIDGRPPGAAHGVDADSDGLGTIVDPRMYRLIRQPSPIADREFEIEFLDPGAQVFVFTFG